ncbi:Fe3+/spermidine/putrescine ABC transporter ATP-binding protein [Mesorhizobium sp. Root157]|uniref:ABC transporter ATP-binding protein n=1 Tax=Mesorhizobium sp. Root157 TaxID=1736477 RepID=UPI000702219B|nr:ABC transporter ATP-binding protein [Mesorhizobium sp. Root157]KRA00191.1 Fe3+/spermidine/putrescine ABC transporter ATP-binding protein [Mesorhizobium sp. Root157]
MAQSNIRFEQVNKSFGTLRVVDDLNLTIDQGEFLSLLGPSGSGKTTILMMLAGFESPTSGTISLGSQRIDQLPPYKRNMGVVFQNYALFPHMDVAANVAFPLEMRGIAKADIAEKVTRALDMVQLGTLKDRRPSQLSGGQQQRVALARALVFEPSVVLMDEPLGALDKQLREQMQLDIRALHRRLGLTIVFVTHDQSEALTMSDRIAVFNRGRIEQIGSPREIYDQPHSRFVAQFIGETNLVEGTLAENGQSGATVALPGGGTIRVQPSGAPQQSQKILVSVRPERIRLDKGGKTDNSYSATITDAVYHGDHLRIQLDGDAFGFIVKADRSRADRSRAEWSPGDRVTVSFSASDCWMLPA